MRDLNFPQIKAQLLESRLQSSFSVCHAVNMKEINYKKLFFMQMGQENQKPTLYL